MLNQLLAQPSSRISHISIIGRKNSPLAEGKSNVTFYKHDDFLQYPVELLEQLKAINPPPSAVVWALGISQTQVSKEQYVVITEQYPLAAAKAFAGLSDKFNFIYVSGEGVRLLRSHLTWGQSNTDEARQLLIRVRSAPHSQVLKGAQSWSSMIS